MNKLTNITKFPSNNPRSKENTVCIKREELASTISRIMANCQDMRLLLLFLQGSLPANPINRDKYKNDKERGWRHLDFLYEEISVETGKMLRWMTIK